MSVECQHIVDTPCFVERSFAWLTGACARLRQARAWSERSKSLNFNILHYDWLDSTNDEAKRLAAEGAAAGTAVVARGQRAGRGQHGRVWESLFGDNLYVSVILRPTCAADQASLLTQQVGEALATVVQGFVRDPDSVHVKLPNDVLIAGKKIAGVLCESSVTNDRFDWVVLGFGLNVNQDCATFSQELQGAATSLYAECGRVFDLAQVLEACLGELRKTIKDYDPTFDTHPGTP